MPWLRVSGVAVLVLACQISASAQGRGIWGPLEQGACTAGGLRLVTAVFRDKPPDLSWTEACARPKNVMGELAPPAVCETKRLLGFIPSGRRGSWLIPDTSCLPSPPPVPVRGPDGTLESSRPLEGFADIHVHQTANLGFGGSIVWGSAFGDPATALGPIPEQLRPGHEAVEAAVTGRYVQAFLSRSKNWHEESGYPYYRAWPSNRIWTHQQVYHDWLFRAYQGGLRLIVMLAANSEDMFGRGENTLPVVGGRQFQKYKLDGRSGNDMEALEWQVRAAYEMQDAIDNAAGGKGRGWYRIVRDPEEAAAAISEGKLAVILGTELQHLFNCDLDRPDCTSGVIQEGLNKLEAMGVNYVFPIHHKQNQFGGAAMFEVVNTGKTEPCRDLAKECAITGLTPLGTELVASLMQRGMLIDTEHLSRKSFAGVMGMVEPHRYPVLAGHVVPLDMQLAGGTAERAKSSEEIRRILEVGGIVAPILSAASGQYAHAGSTGVPIRCDDPRPSNGSAEQWANAYLLLRDLARGAGSAIGSIAFGSDWNGFAGWPGPRFETEHRCQPRRTAGGATIDMEGQVSYPIALPSTLAPAAEKPVTQLPVFDWPAGTRFWNYNAVGAAHIGMLPDFIENLRMFGLTLSDLEPVYRSARAVANLWETARSREVAGDLHHLRWAPQSPFDILTFDHWDESRNVTTAAGLPICRSRSTQRLGQLVNDACETVEAIVPAPPAPSSEALIAYHAGRCLDVKSRRPGSRAIQNECSSSDTQRWELRQITEGVYQIANRGTGFCLSIEAPGASGSTARQARCASEVNQQWKVGRTANTFSLVSSSNSRCLEITDESRKSGAPVREATCTSASHQRWTIESLRINDYERLYQAGKGQFRWADAASAQFPVVVTVDGVRGICQPVDGSSPVGVIESGQCVSRGARSGRFLTLFQSR